MRVLAIGSHPDDIELGCGGTLLQLDKAESEIFFLVLSHGEAGGDAGIRDKEQGDACSMCNVKDLIWGNYRDAQIRDTSKLIAYVYGIIGDVRPDLIFSHYFDDTHQDHRNVGLATAAASSFKQNLMFYEGPTSHDFHPRAFTDIRASFTKKVEMVKKHNSQVIRFDEPHRAGLLDFVHETAAFRGKQASMQLAEGFIPHSLRGTDVLQWLSSR